ncbi:histidine phosphatase family protein [Caldicellulosiruptor sp. F32]|uniref:histidine phosphatase family protein n=1 Tax=Caldicellulosiruptor sp. F32 TaxID=1214564 RepID=UPI0003A04A31|nr:histidine phosphatase family protein [Caldicellulosiruptor sp. F32]
MSKTVIYLIRHAEAEGNFIRRFHGITDSNVTEKGKLQAQRLAERLKSVHFDAIYSSPLKRALYTAQQIAKGRDIEIIIRNDLVEINGGDWEDRCWDELPILYPKEYELWEKRPHEHCMPNGESMYELYLRAVSAFEDIVKTNAGKCVCIVTHGTLIRALLTYIKGYEFERLNEILWQDNTAINIIEYKDNRYNLLVEGDWSHLGEELSTIAYQDWWQQFLKERGFYDSNINIVERRERYE